MACLKASMLLLLWWKESHLVGHGNVSLNSLTFSFCFFSFLENAKIVLTVPSPPQHGEKSSSSTGRLCPVMIGQSLVVGRGLMDGQYTCKWVHEEEEKKDGKGKKIRRKERVELQISTNPTVGSLSRPCVPMQIKSHTHTHTHYTYLNYVTHHT